MKAHFNSNFQISEEQQIAHIYHVGRKSLAKIAKVYGVTIGCIYGIVKKHNVTRPNNKLNPEQEQRLIEEYQSGKSVQQLAIDFVISDAWKVLKRHKVKTRISGHNSRKYQLNENLFDNLNNEVSAYLLGFIYADGSINKQTLNIALSVKDLSHLEKIRSIFGKDIPIKDYIVKTPQGNYKKAVRLSVHSRKMTQQLLELGIVKKRGWFTQLTLPNLQIESYRHFIRGIVDGDGSLDSSRKNNARLRILGQLDILNWIATVFESELNVPYREPRQRIGIMELEYGGAAQARTIITWLYRDAKILLERKINRMGWW